jgi:hypothetical protein
VPDYTQQALNQIFTLPFPVAATRRNGHFQSSKPESDAR